VHVAPAAKEPGVVDPNWFKGFGTTEIGAVHSSEVQYIFGALDKGIEVFCSRKRIEAQHVDYQVSAIMQEYWTNFAKTGDPNGGALPRWPKFDASKRPYIQFTSTGPIAKQALRREQCDLFIENLKRRMTK